jgi:aspartate/methionine/tyrosine aminotransferase
VFSSRLKWDLRPNPLSLLIEEKRRAGANILDLTESNPTHAGFQYDPSILNALADPRALSYDPSPLGLAAAREAVAQYYSERGISVDPSRILLTASTSEAYSYIFKLLTDPGDEVLIPRPSYPLYDFLAGLEYVDLKQYPLRYDGTWHVDFEALESAIGSRTRAIVVVNPNNPTGSFLKRAETARLQAIAARRNLAILSDEVFSDYGCGADPERAWTLASGNEALSFSMSGLSKMAGLPQMKLGWMVVSGPRHQGAIEHLELIADTYLSVATPIQTALPKILAASASVRDQIRVRTASNLELLRAALAGSAVSVLNVEGGWYAIVQVPSIRSEEAWATSLLQECDVLVQPGFFYDFESEAYLVLSLLTDSGAFAEGVRRLQLLL